MSAATVAVARGRAEDLGSIVAAESRTLAELADLFRQAHAVPPGFTFAELYAERQALEGAQAAHKAAKGAGATPEELKRLHDAVRAVKARITRWKQTAWISFGTYSDARRRRDTLLTSGAFVGDADHGARLPKLLEDLDRLGCASLLHTSTSHGCEGIERYRVIIPLAQPLSAPLAQYPPLWEHMQKALGGVLDPGAKDPTRASFMPRIPTGAQGHQVICIDNRPWFDAASLPAVCQVAEAPGSQAPQTTISAEQEADLRAALTHPTMLEALGDNQEWTRLGYGLLSLGAKGFELFRWASERAPNYDDGAPERWWAEHTQYAPQSDFRSIYKRAAELGWSNPRVAATSTAGTFPLIAPDGAPAPVALQRTAGGRIIPNASNALAVLEQQAAVRLTHDEFDERMYVKWPEDPAPRTLTDEDTTRIRIALQRAKLETLSAESTHAVIQLIAHRNPTNRLADWLTARKWDGTRRLSLLMPRGFGTPPTRYYIRAGRNLLVSMVARALSPGCQVDEAIVLEGPQGCGKSSALRIIGGDYFKELTADPRTKDFEQQLHGVWLGEFAELNALRRPEDISRLKQFVTCRVDHYRPPYGREVRDYPRRTVLCGSTNEAEWIHDTTGARRFIPIKVGQIDLEWLNANREQLFAEAVMLYRQKQRRKWWIYPKEETLAQQEARTEEDPWMSPIRAYLQGRGEILNTAEVLTNGLHIQTDRQTKQHQMRVAQCLLKLKCRHWEKQVRRDGKQVRPWTVPEELARAPMLIAPPLTFPTPGQLAPAMQPLPPAANADLA